jgi:hypothetical protein
MVMAKATSKPAKPKSSIGEFSPEIATEICDRIARGESLRKICGAERDDFTPSQRTVFKWLAENDAFAQQYARARERQADHYVDEIVEIADAPNATVGPDGEPILRDPQRDRLRVDARKWVAAKLAPKKYGERVAHTGADGGAIQVEARRALDARNLDPEKREQLRQMLTEALAQVDEADGVIEGEYTEKGGG